MGKQKPRTRTAEKVMKFVTYGGTPREQDEQKHAEEREAKRWLMTRIRNHREFAVKFNKGLDDQLAVVQESVSSINLMLLGLGAEREWSARDEPSGVTFVYRVERIA